MWNVTVCVCLSALPVEVPVQPVHVVLYIDNENLHPMERNRVLRRVRELAAEVAATARRKRRSVSVCR